MSAYEIGTKVIIEPTHEEGVISGVGQIDWEGSTSGVYGVDVGEGPQKVVLAHEEDLTFPDETHDVVVNIVVTASVEAETAAIARSRLIDNLANRMNRVALEMTEEDRNEELAALSIKVIV
ncbi:MAG TPA: hypothetical protein VN756_00830 [Solirubrobacterales bacterium]|nr:hypothetical protein [Solirubrobacterales bacterium]